MKRAGTPPQISPSPTSVNLGSTELAPTTAALQVSIGKTKRPLVITCGTEDESEMPDPQRLSWRHKSSLPKIQVLETMSTAHRSLNTHPPFPAHDLKTDCTSYELLPRTLTLVTYAKGA